MTDAPKSMSMVMTLYDDAMTRKWYTVMTKTEIMSDDPRNYEGENEGVGTQIEEFIQWGKSYRVTFEEVES